MVSLLGFTDLSRWSARDLTQKDLGREALSQWPSAQILPPGKRISEISESYLAVWSLPMRADLKLYGNWTVVFSLRHIIATISWVFITAMRSLHISCYLITLIILWGIIFRKTEVWKGNVTKATELVSGLSPDPILNHLPETPTRQQMFFPSQAHTARIPHIHIRKEEATVILVLGPIQGQHPLSTSVNYKKVWEVF